MRRSHFVVLFLLVVTQSASASPTANYCESTWSEPGASVQTCGALHVVRLKGTPTQRARLMGTLVRNGKLSPDVIHYFTEKVMSVAEKKSGPWVARAVALIYHQLVRLFHNGAPPAIEEEVDALSEALGIDSIILKRGLSLPDTAVFLHGLGSHSWLHSIPTAGCTSVAAKSPEGFAVGRNLDFAGVGVFDKHPMVYLAEPEAGSSELKHLIIGADGVAFGGITGVNEKGITLAVHQNFSHDISVHGVPMLFIGELVLRQARSLNEAVELLRLLRPAVLWTFVLTDLHSGEAIAVESSSSQFSIRKNGSEKFFVQTNHGMNAESRASDESSFGVEANSIFRMEQAFRLLEKQDAGVRSLAKMLSYQEDPEGRLSAYHDILKAETIQTVLYEAHAGSPTLLFVSTSETPSSAGDFVSFPLESFWHDEELRGTLVPNLAGATELQRRNQRASAEAYRLYFDEQKPREARKLMEGQATLDAALFRSVAFLQEAELQEAVREVDSALREPRFQGEPAYLKSSLERVRLTALYRLERHVEAVRLASALLERDVESGPGGKKLHDLAKMIVNGKKPPRWLLDLGFDFFSGDLSGRKN